MTTEELLRAIKKSVERAPIVEAYAEALKLENRAAVDWVRVNAAIKRKAGGVKGLRSIKVDAWDLYEMERRRQLATIEIGDHVYFGKVTDETDEEDGDITYALVLNDDGLRHVQAWLRVDDYDPNPEARNKTVTANGKMFVGRVRGTSYRPMGGGRYAFGFTLGPLPAALRGVESGGAGGV